MLHDFDVLYAAKLKEMFGIFHALFFAEESNKLTL
jgi:hypothetical protein